MNRLRWAALLGTLLTPCLGNAAMHVLVVAGIGGEPVYEERFAQWSEQVAQAAATATGDAARVQRLSGAEATRVKIEAALGDAARELRAGDQFVLLLLGHGSFDGNEYRLNIAGPDLTGAQIGALLDRIPAGVAQLVVNATSTSGAAAEIWAKPQRVVIAATKTGRERNATRFGGFWAQALSSEEADTDKDGNITAQEAYDFAVRKVNESYKSDAAIVSEHARISGNEPSRFVLARRGAAALFSSDAQLVAMRGEQDGIERRIGEIKGQKGQLAEDAYYERLEPALLELARLGARIDARLAALGAAQGGTR
ncbi:MAG: hypothetical protein ABW278_16490 [Steroidobacteraceae bacterium]